MRVAVITSLYGENDDYQPVCRQSVPCEEILVTDRPRGAACHVREFVEPRPWLHDRLAAKRAKCLPWLYTTADVIVWRDANIDPTDRLWLEWMLDHSATGISQFVHPHRNCLSSEAAVSSGMTKYAGHPVIQQAANYLTWMPAHWGLWATGLIVYRTKWGMERFGARWLEEQYRWGYQDQISHPYICHDLDIRPNMLPGDIFHPPHAIITPHRTDT